MGSINSKYLFVMYADFESILIPVKERYEDRMKELKISVRVQSHIQKSLTDMCLQGGAYIASLLMVIFKIL